MKAVTPEWFWTKVDRSLGHGPDGHCWLWTGRLSHNGYGRWALPRAGGKQRLIQAHRFSYESVVGPIPDGLQLDHLCRVRNCVNPVHLEPVTGAENTARGESGRNFARRTRCKNGHAFDEANTRRTAKQRVCRRCIRDASARYKARLKAQRGGCHA